VPLREGYRSFPVVTLPSELLVYRVDNGRLITDLHEALGDGEALAELHRQEDQPATQQRLHDLLIAKARDPRGPILAELERQSVQTDPLLVDARGVVVNGNRRLSAMRVLVARDPERYAHLAAPLVVVLPAGLEREELEFIEVALQLAPETKLAYTWLDRRLKLREQRDSLHVSTDWILEAYRLEDEQQLMRELGELDLVEDCLSHFLGTPAGYSGVEDAEALFVALHAQLSRLNEPLRDAWKAAGFLLIAARAAMKERNFDRHFPFADAVPAHLPGTALRRLAQERGLIGAAAASDALSGQAREGLVSLFADARPREELAGSLLDLLQEIREIHQEGRKPQKILNRIREARRMLEGLEPDRLDPTQRKRLRGEAAALQAQIAGLLSDDDLPPASPQPSSPPRRPTPGLRKRIRRWFGTLRRGGGSARGGAG
jgi:hypothetical protein